jgi:hypothetical protein
MNAPTLRDAEALVGLAYVPGHFDCGHLAVLVQERLFTRAVALPLPGQRPSSPLGQARALARCREALCNPLAGAQRAQTGDVVLFIEEAPGGGVQWHIGTVFKAPAELWVLHIREGASSLLQRLDCCLRSGLMLEGFYRWK